MQISNLRSVLFCLALSPAASFVPSTSFVANRHNVLPHCEDVGRSACVSMNLVNNDDDTNTQSGIIQNAMTDSIKSVSSVVTASTVFFLAMLSPSPILGNQAAFAAPGDAPATTTKVSKKRKAEAAAVEAPPAKKGRKAKAAAAPEAAPVKKAKSAGKKAKAAPAEAAPAKKAKGKAKKAAKPVVAKKAKKATKAKKASPAKAKKVKKAKKAGATKKKTVVKKTTSSMKK